MQPLQPYIYIAPENNFMKTMEGLEKLEDFLTDLTNPHIIIYGDFNLNALKYEHGEHGVLEPIIEGQDITESNESENENLEGIQAERAISYKLVNISDNLGLNQLIEKPTYRKEIGKSYLDQLFSNIPNFTEQEQI